MKKFVQIASSVNINVAPDLRCIDATNPTAPMADKLSVKSAWSRFIVPVKMGMAWYPAQLKNWDSVKALANDGIFTIGAESDTCPNQEEVEALCKKLDNAQARFDSDVKSIEDGKKSMIKSNVESILSNITKE